MSVTINICEGLELYIGSEIYTVKSIDFSSQLVELETSTGQIESKSFYNLVEEGAYYVYDQNKVGVSYSSSSPYSVGTVVRLSNGVEGVIVSKNELYVGLSVGTYEVKVDALEFYAQTPEIILPFQIRKPDKEVRRLFKGIKPKINGLTSVQKGGDTGASDIEY